MKYSDVGIFKIVLYFRNVQHKLNTYIFVCLYIYDKNSINKYSNFPFGIGIWAIVYLGINR